MPRPVKFRRVCHLPEFNVFGPLNGCQEENETVLMSVEEMETIRLIDLEGLNQEQCADIMGVARSTIQRIYDDARKKLAKSLVEGKVLKIAGGNYKICSEITDMENCHCCYRRNRHRGRRG